MAMRALLRWQQIGLAVVALTACNVFAQELPGDVTRMLATFNDEKLQFREAPVIIGSEQAKLTAVFFYAPTCIDSSAFLRDVYAEIKKTYIDTNKLRLIIYDYPLNWRDMQLISGLRCLPADKQLDAIVESANKRLPNILRKATFTSAPGYFASTLTKFGLSEEQAEKCMRNVEIIGHVEGMRKLAAELWNISVTPTLLIGDSIYTTIGNFALVSEILDKHLKQ